MRDPNRIRPLLGTLEALWNTMPDMRFFQLIRYIESRIPEDKQLSGAASGVCRDCEQFGTFDIDNDTFNIEDDVALEAIVAAFTPEPIPVPTERHSLLVSRVIDAIVRGSITEAIYFDGGARGNGSRDALAGWAFVTESGYYEGGVELGATNNEMEYAGLLHAIQYAIDEKLNAPIFRGDSKLVVEQVNGRWQCNAENLKPLLVDVITGLASLPGASVEWVPREMNPADVRYNEVLDHTGM